MLSALAVSLFIYTGAVRLPEFNRVKTLFPENQITSFVGKISSNPVPVSSKKYYTISLDCLSCFSGDRASSAKGNVKVLIPSEEVEALYPGHLFSLMQNESIIYEKGTFLECYVFYIDDGLYVSKSVRPVKNESVETESGCGSGICGGSKLGRSSFCTGGLNYVRAGSRLNFKRLMYSWKRAGSLVLSLLSGSREYLEDGVSDSFRLAGLSHILALSGMHLAFFAGLAGGTGLKILGKRFSFWAKLSGILFFVWFAGLSPSLYRALLCSLISLFLPAFYVKNPDQAVVLSVAFLIHAVTFPEDLFSPAFLLSYGALAGILFISPFFNKYFVRILPQKTASSFAASLGAQAFTMPVSVFIFGSASPVGIISSVIVSPLISCFFSLSVLSIIFSFVFPSLSFVPGYILNMLYSAIMSVTETFAKFPSLTF